ncbi:FKBP-type peptidyl-prolyl cis-trans isomerase [Paraferrimonas haliotis]|uniref:Peptidyl-prolyl cis-trans isomerase n=1 Tax=Paraferrimonas haliotis TaxID=2013866 RepID=A0AA37TJ87_9GAMM|nr:peptidylprolyl isomerase [Paraferrimonas haliotis]GLS82537.1 peptidyl-prolyl cis-trans isomerase [Paraferrimonas haliotis]
MTISDHKVVTLHYRLSDAQGQLIESSFDGEPMVYIHGADNMIPGLESQLTGKQVGDKLTADVAAADAYGEFQEALRQEVPVEAFGDIEEIVPGMRFIAETDAGQRPVQVVEVKDETIVVDGNHPLAGVALSFDVEIVDIRDASAEEIAHGHVHEGSGGCCGGDSEAKAEGGCCGGGGNGDCNGSGGCGGHHH